MGLERNAATNAAEAYAVARMAYRSQFGFWARLFAGAKAGPKRILSLPNVYAEIDKLAATEFRVLVEPLITTGGKPVLSTAQPLNYRDLIVDQVTEGQEIFAKGEYPQDEAAFLNGGHSSVVGYGKWRGRSRFVARFDRLNSSFNSACIFDQSPELYMQVPKPLYTRHDAGWLYDMRNHVSLIAHKNGGGCPVFSTSPLQHVFDLFGIVMAMWTGVVQLNVFDSGLMPQCHVINANSVIEQVSNDVPYREEHEHTLIKALLPDTRLCTANYELDVCRYEGLVNEFIEPALNVLGTIQINPFYIDYVDLEVFPELKSDYKALYREAVVEIGPHLLEAENPDVEMSENALRCLVKKIETFNERMSQFHIKRLAYKAAEIYGRSAPAYKQLMLLCENQLHTMRSKMIHRNDACSSVLSEDSNTNSL